ncbi:MAG: ABC transporter ATP-binding protein, partial [Planctomycetota bacterium]
RGHLAHQLSLSDLAQRHRIHLRCDSEPQPPMMANQTFAVERIGDDRYRIDTQGDLANCLSWLQSLEPSHLRIEPYGLASVYRSVHLGDEVIEDVS